MYGLTYGLWCLPLVLLGITTIVVAESSSANVSTSAIPLSLSAHTRYYCYLRCLAKCVQDHKVSSLGDDSCSNHCEAYRSDRLCDSADNACWSRCKDLVSGSGEKPPAPQNVSVAFTSEPSPTPHEADLNWDAVPNANLYVVQYLDKTDAFQKWTNDGGNISFSNSWHFRKPSLCPEYTFRVAAVNSFGVSSFSSSVDLPVPRPMVRSPQYNVTSIELLDKPFQGVAADDPTFNTTVRVVVSYTAPSNWNLSTDIVRVEPTFHLAESPLPVGQPLAPYLRPIPGEPLFEILLPGDLAFAGKDSTAIFTVDRLYTKCNPGRAVEYPSSLDHVLFIEFNCATVRGGVCPGAAPIKPFCVFNWAKPIAECVNESLANVTMTFSDLAPPGRGNHSVLYYSAIYGPIVRLPDGSPVPTLLPLENATHLEIPAEASSFQIPELLPLTRDYAASICAVFDRRDASIDWNITFRYPIDLTNPKKNICSRKKPAGSTLMLVALPVAFVVLVAFMAVIILYVRTRRQNPTEMDKHRRPDGYENGYVDMPRLHDRWEIPRSHLLIYEDQKLGSGAFGAVYKGKIRGRALMSKHSQSVLAEEWMKAEDCDVAVKMLPEYADEGAKSEFRKEINLMKQLGHHERLVNMVCCITADEPLCLVVEYCSDGDLLHYLRDRCKYMVKLQEQGVDLASLPEDHDVDLNYILTIKDLLMFSWQICVGLEYLSEKNYIHRDVAARNIMVDAGKRAKIGDFGLCRYSCSDPIYMGKGGRLPWKWMALEAIKNYEFTTKSDVWSFGILLFEIVTLGGSPYPGIDPGTMEKYLDEGNRLAQPDNCPDEFYAIMMDCWNAYPEKRPTFSDLRERLSKQLEHITEDYSYLHLNQSRDYYNMTNQYNSKPLYPGSLAPISDDDFDAQASDDSVLHNTNEASTSFVNRAFESDLMTHASPDLRYHSRVTKSSSYPAQSSSDVRRISGDSGIPSDAASVISTEDGNAIGIGARLHRDSAGSDQMLISSGTAPGTPKQQAGSRLNKFFKLKPAHTAERLDTLPESTPSGTGGSASRKESTDVGSVNPMYTDHLLISELTPENQQKPIGSLEPTQEPASS